MFQELVELTNRLHCNSYVKLWWIGFQLWWSLLTGRNLTQRPELNLIIISIINLIIITFLLCSFHAVSISEINKHDDKLWLAANILANCNHSLNFFLYILSGKQFRNEFLTLVGCEKSSQANQTGTTRTSNLSSTCV